MQYYMFYDMGATSTVATIVGEWNLLPCHVNIKTH